MGGISKPKFYTGAIVVQLPEALDRFVASAPADAELVYCEAPEPQYGEAWSKAGELARDGFVRLHSRRRAGGGWQWYMVRTGKRGGRAQSPQDKALADRATAAIFTELKRAANLDLPCPSDASLADKAGLSSRDQAAWRVRKLIAAELIGSTLVYDGGIAARVVTIEPGPHAGTSGGKDTALPKKWAALRRAAARDAASQAGGGR